MDSLKVLFFPATVTEWNDLDYSLRKDPSINVFTHAQCSFHQCFHACACLKHLTRLCLGLSHLRGHKFEHNFSECLDEICMCGKDIKSTNHFLLHCSLCLKERQVLMDKIRDIDSSLIDQNENSLCYALLFGKEKMNDNENVHILNVTEYILHLKGSTYLNKSKRLQLITTTIMNDSILFELNIPF